MRQGTRYLMERNLNERLLKYAESRRRLDEKTRPTDRFLHIKPSKSIMQFSEFQFRNTIGHWYLNVESEIRRYERRLKVEEYRRTGESQGFWQTWLGDLIARRYPSYCGFHMKRPPPYFDVWTENDRDAFNSYDCSYHKRAHQHQLFWAASGFVLAVTVQVWGAISGNHFLPRNPSVPFLGAFAFSFFPGSFFNIFHEKQRKRAMHELLNSEGTFIAAKARLIADDTMNPEWMHNRQYLEFLPRDKFDSFLYSNTDDSVAMGEFDKKKWDFVLRENQEPLKLSTWSERKDYVKHQFYVWLGMGFHIQKPLATELNERT